MKEGDTVRLKQQGVDVIIIDVLSTQLFVKDADGEEFFVFTSEVTTS